METLAQTLAEALSRGLPGDRVVADPDLLAALSHDEAAWAPAGRAAAAVRARSEAEVQHVVRTCAELGAAIVPRGAGTGLSGGANAVAPTRRWNGSARCSPRTSACRGRRSRPCSSGSARSRPAMA
jgi:FAD binding domain